MEKYKERRRGDTSEGTSTFDTRNTRKGKGKVEKNMDLLYLINLGQQWGNRNSRKVSAKAVNSVHGWARRS